MGGYGSLNAKPGGKLAVENPPAINRESKKASFSGSIYGHETAPVVDREAKRNSFKGSVYSPKSESNGVVQVDADLYLQPTDHITDTKPKQTLNLEIPSYESTVESPSVSSIKLERSTSKAKQLFPMV